MASDTDRENPENIRALHSGLVAKRTTLNQMMWQAPVISLTRQAFLLTIAFGDGKNIFYRIMSGLVAMLIGLMSCQLFLRHKKLETHATCELCKLEKDYFGRTFHERPESGQWPPSAWMSHPIWKWGLILISLTGLFPLFEYIWRIWPCLRQCL